MNLNALNPFSWLETILVWIGILAVGLAIGAYGGCEFKQAKWDAEKISQMEEAKTQEGEDKKSGAETVVELKKDEKNIVAVDSVIKTELAKRPTLINCPVIPIQPKALETKNEIPLDSATDLLERSIKLSPDFIRLHDLRAQPGNIELRAGTLGISAEVEVTEGFELILENYKICTLDQARLLRLQERIQQKRKTFQPD